MHLDRQLKAMNAFAIVTYCQSMRLRELFFCITHQAEQAQISLLQVLLTRGSALNIRSSFWQLMYAYRVDLVFSLGLR